MTKIVFYRSQGIFYGFEERGHVGFGEWGEDPFCAMLSSITMYIVDAIEEVYGSRVDYRIDEENATSTVLMRNMVMDEMAAQRISSPSSP